MGGRRERGGGNLYGGRTRVSLFTMGRLIVRGGPNSWHLPSQKKVRVFSSPPFPSLPPCLPSFGLLARTLCAITKKIGPGSGALFPACAKETGPADWIVMCSGKRHPPFPLPLRPLQRSDKYSNLRSLYHPARSSVTVYLPAPLPSSHENAASLCGLRYEASFVYHLQLRTSVLPVLPPSPLLPPRSLSNTSFSFFPGSAPFTSTLLGGDTLTPHPPHTRSIPFSASGLSQEVPALPAVILATPPFFPFHRPPTSTLLFDCPLPLPCSTRELARVPGVLLALNRGLSCSPPTSLAEQQRLRDAAKYSKKCAPNQRTSSRYCCFVVLVVDRPHSATGRYSTSFMRHWNVPPVRNPLVLVHAGDVPALREVWMDGWLMDGYAVALAISRLLLSIPQAHHCSKTASFLPGCRPKFLSQSIYEFY